MIPYHAHPNLNPSDKKGKSGSGNMSKPRSRADKIVLWNRKPQLGSVMCFVLLLTSVQISKSFTYIM